MYYALKNTAAVWENTAAVWKNTNAVWKNTNAVLGKYCRHLKKYERRFGSMTLIKATAPCLIEMQGYATFSAGFTPKCTPNNLLKSSYLSIISAGLHSFMCNPAKVS